MSMAKGGLNGRHLFGTIEILKWDVEGNGVGDKGPGPWQTISEAHPIREFF